MNDYHEKMNRRLDLYSDAVRMDLMSITAARVQLGTASLPERLGYRWPWLFRGWAAANERRDRRRRELQEMLNQLKGGD